MPILPGLSPVAAKSLTATFDAGRLSSDGGLIVLREIGARLRLAETITGPLRDDRDPTRVRHSYAEMATARMLMIAAGYEDCDDVDALRTDPALKIAVGRCPETGADLMSQPTLSRLENLAGWRALARIGLGQIDLYCRSFARPPARIVLDIDDTDDPVHGQQELALFNAHYDCTCFQPIHIFDGLTGKPVLSLLRPGKRPSGEEVAKVLRHVIGRIRKHWPHVAILVRGDSHYCSEPALALLEALRCDYIIGFAINSKLLEIAAPWRQQCDWRRSKLKPTVRRFHQLPYRAHEWSRSRKLLARVEATSMGTDVRFIVTSLQGRGKTLYEKGLLCTRQRREPDQGHEAVHAIRQDGVLALASQPVPPLRACGRLLAAAFAETGGTETLPLAQRDLRDDPADLREGRRPRRGVEGQDQAGLPGQLPSRRNARGHDRRHHDAWPMSDAACAARALPNNLKRVPHIPKPTPSTRLPRHAAAKEASTSRIEWARRAHDPRIARQGREAPGRSLRLARLP
jgi:hypothetical protein